VVVSGLITGLERIKKQLSEKLNSRSIASGAESIHHTKKERNRILLDIF